MADTAQSQDKDDDNTLRDTLINLNTGIKKDDSFNIKKKYTKIIQKKFDGNKAPEVPKENEQFIKINLIAIIYKQNNNYELKFKIIKYNNKIDIAKFINEKKSIYVYHRISTIIDKNNCINFNEVIKDNEDYNIFLRIIKQTNKNILYTLSYIFDNITYNIQLNIPIIIILTGKDKLIMIDYSKSTIPIGTFTDTNTNIDLTLLSIISKQLFTTITKYLKDNFENELNELLNNYNDDERIFNIDVESPGEKYRTKNNIDSIINNKKQ